MTTFTTSRAIAAQPEQIFAAISDPQRLAHWWGPAGFTNTFELCEFKQGGRWLLTMRGPGGSTYPNESRFLEIDAPSKVVVQHISEPAFTLTVSLVRSGQGTVVTWSQAFADDEQGRRLEYVVVPANEQNLDRLAAEVLRTKH
jgi:uncharacterized protein YndB with AHSA1/START domain